MTGQQLFDRWVAFIRRYVVVSDAQALTLALWAITTFVSEHFSVQPYLEIVATSKRAGKTTVLDVLSLITRNAQQMATIRVLMIARMIGALEGRCTILLDETEILRRPTLGDTRQCLASGYRAGATHGISVGQKVIKFPVACMKAFAQIGNIQDVLRDRCIEIELTRGVPERVLSEWRDAAEGEAAELVEELKAFAKNRERWSVHAADWLRGRERELWTPLYSVAMTLALHADTLRAFQAASVDIGLLKTLPAKEYHELQDAIVDADDQDAAERVLSDMLIVLRAGETFVPSTEMVNRLRSIEIAPWRGWRGTGLNEMTLAALLSRYGVEPVQKRVQKKPKPATRGYLVADLVKAAAR